MDRLHSDPRFSVCPNFMSERYHISRISMVTANVTEAQAADTLHNIWVTTNEDLCLQWQQQLAEDDRLKAEKQCLDEEDQERQRAALQLEEAAARADEKKKNRLKHIPIPMCPCPFANDEEALILISEFTICKLDKGQYIELYYWTNHGLDDAMVNYRTCDNNSLVPTTSEDGSTVWISSASSKPASGIIADRHLSPADFAQAIPCIVAALEEHDWPQQCVLMLAQFWGAIMLHCYWNSCDLLAQRAIMLFQEEQRRAWHNTIPSSKGAWDISVIDEPTLACTFKRVYHALLIRSDVHRQDIQVSTSFQLL
ncbi:uncharacterized protein F5891DRAFT_947938 [Suillus fuscotomentosus]|uniref:Uncharacterized protein n=1 Tax=Suillus fuscotomentosus TaxID=1912939 RepID=A0AAD4EBJ5_9AGAM|nr:uncharacterized protein F5891DRAFT_947938 [Suillus fuscotomentosus]KAG1903141.1 hypothetical protein F5891DRAFT_947938 [Suillus fuscotomentosus]